MEIHPNAFATELNKMIPAKIGHRYCIINRKTFLLLNVPPPYVTSSSILFTPTTLETMLMYSKEANNRKQEIDRQHHTIPNQRANDKHHGNVYNLLFRYGKVRSQNMEKLKSSFPTFCKRTFPQLHKIASYAHYAQCRLLRKPSHFIIYSRK